MRSLRSSHGRTPADNLSAPLAALTRGFLAPGTTAARSVTAGLTLAAGIFLAAVTAFTVYSSTRLAFAETPVR